MNTNTPEARQIVAALRGELSRAEIDEFIDDEIQEHAISVSEAIWKKDQRNGRERDMEQVINSYVKGAYAEFSVYLLLKAADLEPEWNNIDTSAGYVHSSKFNHDIRCLGLKLEVKSQNFIERKKYFSYKLGEDENEYKKIKNFREGYEDYDLLIAVMTNYHATCSSAYFKPWLVLDNQVFETHEDRDQDLFTNMSEFEGSWFLKMGKCYTAKKLEYIQRCTKFDKISVPLGENVL